MRLVTSVSQPNAQAMEALKLFTERFRPAADITGATHFYTTSEVHGAISELFPGSGATAEQVALYLQDAGYKFEILPETFKLQYKWLLIAI